MLDTTMIRQTDMPAEMQTLLRSYPRDDWPQHPGFKDKTKHWLSAHRMFRRLATQIRSQTETLLDHNMDLPDYADRLSYLGGQLVHNLHGHHTWEDRSYFPELSAADPRFDRGLQILEQDHSDMDRVLDQFSHHANRTIKLTTLDPAQALREAVTVHQSATTIEAFLNRHLSDEEDLAVPIILHYRLRG